MKMRELRRSLDSLDVPFALKNYGLGIPPVYSAPVLSSEGTKEWDVKQIYQLYRSVYGRWGLWARCGVAVSQCGAMPVLP